MSTPEGKPRSVRIQEEVCPTLSECRIQAAQERRASAVTTKDTRGAPHVATWLTRHLYYCCHCKNRKCYVCNNACGDCCLVIWFYIVYCFICVLIFIMFINTINMRKAQDPYVPPLRKLIFTPNTHPGIQLVPANADGYPLAFMWYGGRGRTSAVYETSIAEMFAEQEAVHKKLRLQPNMTKYGPCANRDYGYRKKAPCIFVKLNNIAEWKPEKYKKKSDIATVVPNSLREQIWAQEEATVWVHCYGETVHDRDVIGKVKYHPQQSFDVEQFPVTPATRPIKQIIAIELSNIKASYLTKLTCITLAGNMRDAKPFVTYIILRT